MHNESKRRNKMEALGIMGFYRSIGPATVRGGIRGQSYNKGCSDFDEKHAKLLNMKIDTRPYKD